MILQRLATSIRKQDWFTVLIETLIVVLGVFLGLQLGNWNSAQADRRDEIATIRATHEDMVEAEKVTDRIIGNRKRAAANLAEATNVLFGISDDRALSDDECQAIVGSNGFYFGRVDLPALRRLQSTGRLDIVRDPALRDALAMLIQQREALELAMTLENYVHDLAHLYPEVFTVRSTLDPSPFREDGYERSFAATCDIGAIRGNQNLMNDIALNADAFDAFVRDGLGPWLAQMDEVHRELDIYLDISHEEDGK